MKDVLTAAAAMVAIILVQMALSFGISYHVGEVFCKTASSALFFYYTGRLITRSRERAKQR